MNFPMCDLNTWFIVRMKVVEALDRPNGITTHSNKPSFVLKSVFHSSPSLILIWWYPLRRSILEKTLAPDKQSSKSSILGSGYRYFTVTLLIALESMHNLHVFPPFLGESKAGIAKRLMLSRMNPFSINFVICLLISSSSKGFIL